MLADIMWQAQQALHGKNSNVVLPALLVSAAAALVLYSHATEVGGSPTKTFLALIMLQGLPLVFLEMKILSCADPVGMLSRFGAKVLLMHACFLALRVCTWPVLEVGMGVCNLLGLLAACAALYFGFGFSLTSACAWRENCVWGLVLLALSAACCTEFFDSYRHFSFVESVIFTASSYIEILAFVPAVLMVYQCSKKSDDVAVEGLRKGGNEQRHASAFFAFLLPLYVMEDVVYAFHVRGEEPLAAAGLIVHFIVLLDFACFLLAHIYNPDKVHGSFLRWLPDQLWV
ncbi:unnamed protein product [Polarella glacialis]|uniref:Uncharacterized protein n=1 Tax=Polarella glacialis TaxID=89957 RepID=A0A813LA71_POLGL|nr:unnamed protein product [Polarella glacialis]